MRRERESRLMLDQEHLLHLKKRRLTLHRRPHMYIGLVLVGVIYVSSQFWFSDLVYVGQGGKKWSLLLAFAYELVRFLFATWVFLKVKRFNVYDTHTHKRNASYLLHRRFRR